MAYAKNKAKASKAKLEVVEDDDEELEDLEVTEAEDDEDEDDEEEEEAPPAAKKRGRPAKTAEPVKKKAQAGESFGVTWLVGLIEEKTGKAYKPAVLRVLLRKMNDAGELGDREKKTRYSFGGEKDPVVVAILKRVKAGEIEAAKKESLDKLKERAASKKIEKVKAAKARRKAAVVEDDDFEDEDDDED